MKIPFNILNLSGGIIEDGGLRYANANVLDENQADQITVERIDVGQKTAKVSISTDNDNSLVMQLANSKLIPGIVMCDVITTVKKGALTMQIVGFSNKVAI